MSIKKSLFCSLVILQAGLFACSNALASPLMIDFGADFAHDDNLSNTPEMAGEAISGVHASLSAAVRQTYVLSEDFSFMAKLGASYHSFDIEDSADYASLDTVVAGTWRPFDGFAAPYFKASGLLRNRDYQNDFASDSYYRMKLSFHNQWSSSVSTQIGVAYRSGQEEWAQVDTINPGQWDTHRQEVFVGMDIRLEPVTLYTKLSYSDGDLIWTRPDIGGYRSDIWRDAEQIGLDLGVNMPLYKTGALDLLGRYYEVRRDGSQMYDNTSLSLAYIHRLSL